MPNTKISQDTTVSYKATLLLPAVDLTLAAGLQNVRLLASSLAVSASSVIAFGADPTGFADSTAAINAAIAAGGDITMPAGTYRIDGTIINGVAGAVKNFRLRGAGMGVTILTSTSTTLPIISLINVTGYAELSNFTLTRTATAGIGADNLTTNATGNGTAQSIYLTNIESMNGWNGFFLGNASFSTVYLCYAHDNYRSGFRLDNGTFGPSIQWTLISCLSQFNGTIGNSPSGSGYEVTTTGSTSFVTMLTWLYCTTFANAGPGASFISNGAASINDIILQSCFFGSDGYSGVFAQTYGYCNAMYNCRIELTGGQAGQNIGRGGGTGGGHAPTLTGNGVELTSAERDWQIIGCYISASAYHGIITAGTSTLISGCNIRISGQTTTATYNGVTGAVGHGQIVVTGSVIGNTAYPPAKIQQNAIGVDAGNLLTATGNDLSYNPGAIAANHNPNLVQASDNLGYIGRASGAALIPNATLAQVITHGLKNGISGPLTPIMVTGTLAGGSAGNTFVVTAMTATTFTVTFASSASGQTLFWTALTGNY